MADAPANDVPYRRIVDVEFGDDVVVQSFTNIYGCAIGDRTRVGPFVEIQAGVSIGADCKLQSHTFVCDGVEIGDGVFIGHGVMFVNDKRPRATTADGVLQTESDWTLAANRRSRRRLDRLRRRHSRRDRDRRGRARRSRCGRDARCGAGGDRRGRPGARAPIRVIPPNG